MKRETFKEIEDFMKASCGESVHDEEHIYRVLYTALDIAGSEKEVDREVLITACLLHDIGRAEELKNPGIDHAEYGSKKAYDWLTEKGFDSDFASKVADCIRCHRFRGSNVPKTIEAKILYDADKIDAAGLIGISRTLMYKGVINEPIYTTKGREIENGADQTNQSFFTEYIHKLSRVYDKILTSRGKELVLGMKSEAVEFYNRLYGYLSQLYSNGNSLIDEYIED